MPELFPPDKRRSLRSQSLDLLRFPLAVVVASIHVIATRSYWADGKCVHFENMPGADWFYGFFDAFLRSQSVPIYFFISGYVFFLGITLTMETYGHKLLNRSKSLLTPYIAWNVLAVFIALITFLPALKGYFPSRHVGLHWSLPSILETFWNSWFGIFASGGPMPPGSEIYPQDYPLWFVRDLMVIVLCAPLIYLLLKKTRWYAVMAMGVAWFLLSPYKLGHFSQLLTGFFFFSWGAHESYHGRDMINDFKRFFCSSTCIYTAVSLSLWLIPSMPPTLYALLKSVNVVAGMVFAYGLAAKLIESRRVKMSRFLASASFFVYAGHGIFVAYVNMILFNLFKPTGFAAVAGIYLLCLIIVTGGLLAIFRFFGKYAPPLQQIFAGRVYKTS